MVDRVIMDVGRVSISKPGFDVKTAGLDGMVWDSRANEYGGIFMTGTVNMYETSLQTISFGRTLPRIPYVWVMGRTSGGDWLQFGLIAYNNNGAIDEQGIAAFASTTDVTLNNQSIYDIDLVRYVVFNIGAS